MQTLHQLLGIADFIYMLFGKRIYNHSISAEFENGPKGFGSRNCSEKIIMKLVLMYQLKSMKIYPKVLRGFVVCLFVCFSSKPVCVGIGRSFTTETHCFQEVQLVCAWCASIKFHCLNSFHFVFHPLAVKTLMERC